MGTLFHEIQKAHWLGGSSRYGYSQYMLYMYGKSPQQTTRIPRTILASSIAFLVALQSRANGTDLVPRL